MRARRSVVIATLLVACGKSDALPPSALVQAPSCAKPTRSDTIDLLPLARLSAVGTATTLGAWTREDKDEPFALRDDDPANGWRPGDGDVPPVAEIDLGPAGGPFALRRLSLVWDGAPGAVEVRVRDACGGGLVAALPATSGDVALDDVCGTCLEIAVTDPHGARLVSAKLESASPDAKPLPLLDSPSAPTALHRDVGVVEGFYGQPWTWDERARIVDTLGKNGLGVYVYAPKDDPLHRAKWRTPYDAAFVARFAELAKTARERGVRAYVALSPFIDYDGSEADRARIVAKLRPFVDAGVDGVAIFADDIELASMPTIDGALGAAHASVTNEVVSALRAGKPDLAAMFVGTVYSDARRASWPTADAYLTALQALDGSIKILWTGTDTFSPTLSAETLAPVASLIARTPAVWDNHWASDGGDAFFGRVLLAPLRHRDGDLLGATSALVENPSIPGATARLQAALLGAWAAAPSADVDATRTVAAASEARYAAFPGEANVRAALVRRVMELFEGSGLDGDLPRHVRLEAALARMTAALAAKNAPANEDVRLALSLAADARTMRSEAVHSTLAIDLVDELTPPLTKVAYAADVVLLGLACIADPSLSGPLLEADGALQDRSRFRFLDDAVHAFAKAASASRAGAGVRPATGDAVPACTVKQPLAFAPFASADAIEVHGLPGARVEGTRVTWTAPHPGRFDAVFVATTKASWATRTETIVCRPP